LLGTGAAAGLLAACSGSQSSGSQSTPVATTAAGGAAAPAEPTPTKAAAPAPANPAAPAPAPTAIVAQAGKGSTVINFWNGLTGSDGQGMVRIVERFSEANPDVSVKIQMIAWRTFYDKLSASLVAGSPPEMWIQHSEDVIRYASKGLMKQLDEITAGTVFPGQSIPVDDMGYTLPYAQYKGKLYSVPLDQYTWCILYNKDLVKAAGLDPEKPPKSGEEFATWGKKLTIDTNGKHPGEAGFDPKNVKQWGFYYNLQVEIWHTLLAQQGANVMITGPDATDVNTDSPQSIKALEEMVSWNAKQGFAPGPTGVNVMEGFWAGKLGMTYNGIWNVNAIKAHPEIKTGVALTPIWYGSDIRATFSGHQMAMPASLEGKKLEQTWKTIKYISDHTLDWAKEGQTPARKSILNSQEFKDLSPQSVFAQQLPGGVILPPHNKLIELNDLVGPAVDAALNGQKTAEDALKEAAQRQRQVLARKD
jgi:ABC-type glycerol-3-phosphate transport system substrate-binding protein